MRTGRPKAELVISADERAQLAAMARSRSLPAALALRARIVLACERAPSNQAVASELGIGAHTVGKWRNRLGQLTIANFVNEAGLQALGGNYFQQTAASGQPTVGVPGDTAFGIIQQGYVEASNVDPVTEITNLIAAQRAYEMNSKVIQAADQMAGTISNMRS